jgi:hypothetical protein
MNSIIIYGSRYGSTKRYAKLGLKHRIMMKLLYSKVLKIPEAERNAEVRALIATYGKQVDFVNFDTLEPIVKVL